MYHYKKTIWEFFIRNRHFTYLIIAGIVLVGALSVIQISKESNPDIDFPLFIIATAFPGAGAEDVEELITNPIEDKLTGISGIEDMESISSRGISMVSILFDVDSDSREKAEEVRSKVEEVKTQLPSDAESPEIIKVRLDDSPILSYAISGSFEAVQLKAFANEVKKQIERVSGVSSAVITGGQDREIQVLIDKVALDRYGLDIGRVTQAISQANSDIPSGIIETAGTKYSLRFEGRLYQPEDIASVPVIIKGGAPILVSDISEVQDSYSEKTSLSRLSLSGSRSESAITLRVFKLPGGDTIEIVDKVNARIKNIQKNILPEEANLVIIEDNARFIREDLRNLSSSGLQTVAIVILILFLALGLRAALIAGTVIPLTFLITFIILNQRGDSLNFLSLFSLILALGVLVDASIVITESIYRKVKEGNSSKDAAIFTLREFQGPLIAGALTTVFAFVPMLLISGIMGKYIEQIPITVSTVLLSSLFVSLGLVTTLGSRLIKLKNGKRADKERVSDKFFNFLNDSYELSLKSLLSSSRRKRVLGLSVALLLIASLSLPAAGIVKVIMFPSQGEEMIYIDIKKPAGTTLESSDDTLRVLEDYLQNDPRIELFLTSIGSSAFAGSGPGSSDKGSNISNAIIKLRHEYIKSSLEIVDGYQKELNGIIDGDLSVRQLGMGPPSGAPVAIEIKGGNLDELDLAALKIEEIVKNTPGTTGIDTSVSESPGEFVIRINRAKAQLYGLNTSQVALALRNSVTGLKATTIKSSGEDIDVLVKYDFNKLNPGKDSRKIDLEAVESMTIVGPEGGVPLSSFTDSHLESSRSSIVHRDGERTLTVTAYTTKGVTAGDVFNNVQNDIKGIAFPEDTIISMGGEFEEIDQSFMDMYKAMIYAILLILGLMVLQFKSFRQPFFIIITIPLALIGVFPGLLIMNVPLSFPGIIGIVALAGIVVNNAIILIDRINNNRRGGEERIEAIIQAGKSRLRPIILTTITTIAGIIPLIMSSPVWAPLGYAIIFGLLFSAALTLFVVPTLYCRFAEKEVG